MMVDIFPNCKKNGELFGDHVFGSIKLRQYQIFSEKDHIKDVVRDFCIQEGFSVIALKADDTHKAVIGDCMQVD